ncbi:MAG TPA: aquaporin [Ktedonobacteraceae bacterium]|jgi:MIP family channel proteins|nr:aquaporin [Ktedonobacteraceae bacterium]
MASQEKQTTDHKPQAPDNQKGDAREAESEKLAPSQRTVEELRRLLAECVGTFVLVTVEAGGVVVSSLFHQDVNSAAHYVSCGLIVMVIIYALGSTSGAHINPAITFAFALRKDFPWKRVPGYWLAQLIGAIAGAALIRLIFGNVEHLGAPLPHMDTAITFAVEALLTFFLVTVVLGVAPKGELVGNNMAISVGGTIALCGLFAGRVSGASMNPARSFAPYLVSGQSGQVWLYMVAPFVGALIAVGMAWLLRGGTNPTAVEAAKGK